MYCLIEFPSHKQSAELPKTYQLMETSNENAAPYLFCYGIIAENWGDLGVDGWIVIRRISRRWDVSIWTGLGWPRIETGDGHL
jgi:hypothetical protein